MGTMEIPFDGAGSASHVDGDVCDPEVLPVPEKHGGALAYRKTCDGRHDVWTEIRCGVLDEIGGRGHFDLASFRESRPRPPPSQGTSLVQYRPKQVGLGIVQ